MEKRDTSPRPVTVGVADFCELIGVSRTTAYGMLKAGQIASIRIGRRRLITIESINRFINSSLIGGAQ